MSNQYRIVLKNTNGATLNFCFFSEPPKLNTNSAKDVYTNVWIQKRVVNTGRADISFTKEFYAYTGQPPVSPAPGVSVTGGVFRPAILGSASSPGSLFQMFNDQGVPNLGAETRDAVCVDSNFAIESGQSGGPFSRADNFLVGMGQVDATTGQVVPTFTTIAAPKAFVRMKPVMKYYVAQCDSLQGQILDYQTWCSQSGVIDFSANKAFGAEVEYTDGGSWNVKYHSQASWMGLMGMDSGALGLMGFDAAAPSAGSAGSAGIPGRGGLARIGDNDRARGEIEAEITRLKQLLETKMQNGGRRSLIPGMYAFKAYLSPGAAAAIASIMVGSAIIIRELGQLGYKVKREIEKRPDGTEIYRFEFGRNEGAPSLVDDIDQAQQAWDRAVAQDREKDGHTATRVYRADDNVSVRTLAGGDSPSYKENGFSNGASYTEVESY
ncbi:Uu.00g063840.m01.CDS01 [Anthostomella pinea]|uniref:Uu.00g063840.m01.CDS01 n=1 Tax=Anthostomella pinea TaxID=933095 RepID=A0AAI8YMX5_9PEZI|nr:Uu.00g063840.m01.CDS01 [Anthostomella pinea]